MSTLPPVLVEILEDKRHEVAAAKAAIAPALMRQAAEDAAAPRDFLGALRGGEAPRFITELKRASPSAGVIRTRFPIEAIAKAYAEAGAACLSVLTDVHFFWGQPDALHRARAASGLPALRKDFIVESYQVDQARAWGADAVLLIVAALPDDAQLTELRLQIEALGMTALVEVHDAAELDRAVACGASLIGVNNRDLREMKVDLAVGEGLLGRIPEGCLAVAESGLKQPEDVARMRRAGARAMLIGESLMRGDDPGAALRRLAQAES